MTRRRLLASSFARALRAPMLRAWIALAPLVLGVAPSCSTPSVPLPPPMVDTSALTFTSPAAGTVILSGVARMTHANVRFFVIDRSTGDGVIASAAADGSFSTAPFAAVTGDVAEIYFEPPGADRSQITCVTVLLAQPLVGASCP